MAIEIPLKYAPYFHAKRATGVLRELADAIDHRDSRKVRQLLSEADEFIDPAMSNKQLTQAAETQHSETAKAFQELVQNSQDKYDELKTSRGRMEVTEEKEGDEIVFSYRDYAGGLDTEGIISKLFTVGSSEKGEEAIGGHGQGFKSMLGIARQTTVESRGTRATIAKKGDEYIASFTSLPEKLAGLRVVSKGVQPALAPINSLTRYCGLLDPEKYDLVQVSRENGVLREIKLNKHDYKFQTTTQRLGRLQINVKPYDPGVTRVVVTQKGQLVREFQQEGPPISVWIDLPGGKQNLQMRGRDYVPSRLRQIMLSDKTLRDIHDSYADNLLARLKSGETMLPDELTVLHERAGLFSRIGASEAVKAVAFGAAATAAAKYVVPSIVNLFAVAGGFTYVPNPVSRRRGGAATAAGEGGEVPTGTGQPPTEHNPIPSIPGNPLLSALGYAAGSYYVGSFSDALYEDLSRRLAAGEDVSALGGLKKLARSARLNILRHKELERMPIIPFVRRMRESVARGMMSIRDARAHMRKNALHFVWERHELENPSGEGVFVLSAYSGILDPHHSYGHEKPPSFFSEIGPNLREAVLNKWLSRTAKLRQKSAHAKLLGIAEEIADFAREKSGSSIRPPFIFSNRFDETGFTTPSLRKPVVHFNLDSPLFSNALQDLKENRISPEAVLQMARVITGAVSYSRNAPFPKHRLLWLYYNYHGYLHPRARKESEAIAKVLASGTQLERQINSCGITITRA